MTIYDLFQGISEIGIATTCVPTATHQLSDRFGVTSFYKSSPQPDFAALGDDNGLFIVSNVSRNWLFTNIPANLNDYRVTFELASGAPVQMLRSDEQRQPYCAEHSFQQNIDRADPVVSY